MKHAYYNQDYNMVELPIIYSSKTQNHRGQNKRQQKPIVVNLGDTQYRVVEEVCEELGWRVEYAEGKSWDIKWTDSAVSSQYLSKMSQHQKVNHFPGMNTLSRKNNLTKCLHRMQQRFEQQYNFYPLTFLLPSDKLRLKAYTQQLRRQNLTKIFIVKPEASSQGRGIFLTQNVNEIQQYSNCVVQKYVTEPLLYKGLKFDLRVYVLVAGCDPLRIYIYNEGLTRFATEKYQQPDPDNFDNLYMHLTNYAINKDHPNYVYNHSVDNLSYGHKKSLAEFFQTLKTLGLKAHQYWSDIKDIIIKTMISGQPHLQHQYRLSQPHNFKNNMCFEVLGFDFMIDANGKSYLLEINHTPSFTTDTPLDELVKSNLIRDTLTLMNINAKTRDKMLGEIKTENQRRVFTGKTKKYTPEERLKVVQELQKERDQWEKVHLGSFEKIYPSKNPQKQQKYEELLQFSLQSYKQTSIGGRTRQHPSPSKFRVKKLITSHTNDEQQPRNDQNVARGRSTIRDQTTQINRTVSTAAKLSQSPTHQIYGMMLNPEKQLKLPPNKDITRKQYINPMMVGSIVSMQKQDDQTNQSRNTIGSVKKIEYDRQLNNRSFKEIRGDGDMGTFLKTREEEATMFSKMMHKTRE